MFHFEWQATKQQRQVHMIIPSHSEWNTNRANSKRSFASKCYVSFRIHWLPVNALDTYQNEATDVFYRPVLFHEWIRHSKDVIFANDLTVTI